MKKFFSKFAYAIIPFAIFICSLLLSFYGNQLLTNYASEGTMHYGTTWPETVLDNYVPLVPWFVYIYFLTFPVSILTYFYLASKNKKMHYDIFLTLVISFLISGIIYFFFQSRLIKPDFTPDSFTDKLLVWTWNSTNPTNNFPSQHCFMAIAVFIACVDCKEMNKGYRVFGCIASTMIVLSTVFTKQHYVVDFFASLAIMLPVYFLVKFTGIGKKTQNGFDKFYSKFKKKKTVQEEAKPEETKPENEQE
ncbi:MAG: phosphatase PAP2 family protein [Clostridia bacterium]|nr:phosphatase PAP2 family protein [Clostridia bacterium]